MDSKEFIRTTWDNSHAKLVTGAILPSTNYIFPDKYYLALSYQFVGSKTWFTKTFKWFKLQVVYVKLPQTQTKSSTQVTLSERLFS